MRAQSLQRLTRFYRSLYRALEDEGTGPYRLTSRGAWATSQPEHVFYFFERVELSRYRLFMDLGSGDGIVTCIAGLFTRAMGIEIDRDLCRTARGAALHSGLGHQVSFICGDYLTQRIDRADCLYLYPDKPLYPLEERLYHWQGTLLVYGAHFPPRHFRPVRHLQHGNARLVMYRDPS